MAKDDATLTDAEENEVEQGFKNESDEAQEEFQETPEEELSPREKAMNAIVELRNDEFEEETDIDLSSEDSEEVEEPVEEIVEETVKPDPVWKDGDNWYTMIKVDGEDIQVPVNDLRTSHQKDKASQKRFEQAAEYGRRVQAREAELNSYYQQMMQQQQMQQQQKHQAVPDVPPSKDAEETGPEVDKSDLIKKYHEALYEDDAVKAAELFTSLTAGGRAATGTTQNVDQAVNQAVNRLMAQQQQQTQRQQQWAYQKSMEDAVHWFNEEYPDIADSPELRAIADNQTVGLTRDNPGWSPKQVIQEAADNTRLWVKENLLSSNNNERVTRKKKIMKHPKAASASSKIGEDEPAPMSATEIIEEMKRSRGQNLPQ